MPETEITEVEASKPAWRLPPVFSLLHVVWLKRWQLLIVWVLVAIPIGVVLSIFDLPRSYLASTVLRFPSVVGAQTNVMRDIAITQGESIISIFNSFPVLEATVRKQSLRLRITTKDLFSKNTFSSIQYTDDLGLGQYELSLSAPDKAELKYHPRGGQDHYTLFKGQLQEGRKLIVPGLQLEIKDDLLRKVKSLNVGFELCTLEETVKGLKESLGIRPLGGSNFQITLKDKDPFSVADILNTLREEFLQVYYGTTEVQDVGILAQMEKDLELAKQRLGKSQQDLSDYYAANPELMQTDTRSTGDNLTYLDARQELDRLQARRDRLSAAVRAKPTSEKPEERFYWAGELLGIMAEAGDPRASILRARLTEINTQEMVLKQTLAIGHPRLQELATKKEDVYRQIDEAQTDLSRRVDRDLSDTKTRMAANAPARNYQVPVKVRLELERMNSVNQNNQNIYDRLLEAYNRAKLTTGSEFFKVSVVDIARPAIYSPPSPKTRLLIAFAAMLVLLVAVPAAFVGYTLLFPRIWTREDVRTLLNVRALGFIAQGEVKGLEASTLAEGNRGEKGDAAASKSESPTQKFKSLAARVNAVRGENRPIVREGIEPLLLFYGSAYRLEYLEAYRMIREEIENYYRNTATPGKLCLLVTSVQPGEGKTLTASNVAITFARKGKRTLLIDADFRLGRINKVFNAPPTTGLDEMLNQSELSDQQFIEAATLCFTPSLQNNLVLVPRKQPNPNAGEMVASDRFKAFLRMARQQFDVVIIDTPPVMITPEPLAIAEETDGVLFVCRSGITPLSGAREAVAVLRDRHVKVAAVLNGVTFSPFEQNRYQKYAYYYREHPPLANDGSPVSRA